MIGRYIVEFDVLRYTMGGATRKVMLAGTSGVLVEKVANQQKKVHAVTANDILIPSFTRRVRKPVKPKPSG